MRLLVPIALLISLFGALSCQSKRMATVLSRGPNAVTKATRVDVTNPNLIEIQILTTEAPRRGAELESAVILTPGVQECLRRAPEIRDPAFSVHIQGHINHTGAAEKVTVSNNSKELKLCLKPQIQAIAFGRGKLGAFKLVILRPSPTEARPKPLYLDLSEDKKFQ